MNAIFSSLANKKWFVPLIIFLMLIITFTSFAEERSDADAGTARTLEEQLEALCNSVHGVKNAKVMITYESVAISAWNGGGTSREKILGIAVVCDGGSDPNVQLSLHTILEALFDLPSTHITVSKRNPA